MPTGTSIRRRALFSQVIAPARRKEPKTRVVHSSTTTREKPSMIGMESRMNSFRPGRRSRAGGNKEAAAPRAVDLQGEVPEERPGENSPGEPFHPVVAPEEQPTRDDPGVVDQGRQRGKEELLPGVLHRHQEPPDVEEDLRGSTMRVNRAASAACAGEKPGAIRG